MALSADSILKLPAPKKVALLIVFLLVILGVYWVAFYRPQLERVRRKEAKLNDLIRERNTKRELAKDYEKYRAELKTIKARLKEVMAKLPEKKEIPHLLKSIANIGKASGLDILLFKPKGEERKEFYARVPFELKFLGRYHQIGFFFYSIAKLPRIITAENFTIERSQGKGEKGILQVSCTASTYRYVEAPPPQKKPERGRRRRR
ncbi:MAG: pilus assembly protein PilO [Deltaproteobacteria bacterium]|nr:MAG: pilus assembly protein PilO [Deltaproteobacteria bacterium]